MLIQKNCCYDTAYSIWTPGMLILYKLIPELSKFTIPQKACLEMLFELRYAYRLHEIGCQF